jgi:hypothetical protein
MHFVRHSKQWRLRLLVSLALLLAFLGAPWTGRSAESLDIVASVAYVARVEEDWVLVLTEPNAAVASPQVSTQMARSPWAARFVNFHLNNGDVPDYTQGGLQLQVWHGTVHEGVANSDTRAIMQTSGETVSWTQYLSRETGRMVFGISKASSETWGDFSGLSVAVSGSLLLDNYSADYSQQNSGVTFGANRVASLTIVQTRIYYSDGTVQTDSTQRPVFAPSDQGN